MKKSPTSSSTARRLTALLLTSLIEWFTQLHYVEHVSAAYELDPLFRDLLRFHWIDEARHAKVDSLMIEELTDNLTLEQREQAVDELLQLGAAIDGLLQKQIELDIETLERARLVDPSPTRRRPRSAASSAAPIAGPSSSPASSIPTSSRSSMTSPKLAAARSQRPRAR